MDCQNCSQYRNSTKRSGIDQNDETGTKPKTRFCSTHKMYVGPTQDACTQFEPDVKFHCQRYNYQLSTTECLARRQKKIFKKCNGRCNQYKEIVELHKQAVFHKRKQAIKPTLIRRVQGAQNGDEE